LAYRDAFVVGDRRKYTAQVLNEMYAEKDQRAIIATQRLAFKKLTPTSDVVVAFGYNIANV
jgi:hypothetical protein